MGTKLISTVVVIVFRRKVSLNEEIKIPISGHDKSWGAEAALRRVVVHHPFLDWVHSVLVLGQPLDRRHDAAVCGTEREDARVDAAMDDKSPCRVVFGQENCASTTTAFTAADFRSAQSSD